MGGGALDLLLIEAVPAVERVESLQSLQMRGDNLLTSGCAAVLGRVRGSEEQRTRHLKRVGGVSPHPFGVLALVDVTHQARSKAPAAHAERAKRGQHTQRRHRAWR